MKNWLAGWIAALLPQRVVLCVLSRVWSESFNTPGAFYAHQTLRNYEARTNA